MIICGCFELRLAVELRNDVDFDTVDLLRDPVHLKKHLALQYVLITHDDVSCT